MTVLALQTARALRSTRRAASSHLPLAQPASPLATPAGARENSHWPARALPRFGAARI
jgi:hypothetical protein